jgi:hypothetical protein
MRSAYRFAVLVTTLLAGLGVACKDGTGPDDKTEKKTVTPRELRRVSGDSQSVLRGGNMALPLRVRVIGSDGLPLAGATVQWAHVDGLHEMRPLQSTTNANGEAETLVTVVQTIGEFSVSATSPGLFPVTFSLFGLDPCEFQNAQWLSLGTTRSGKLEFFDCSDFGGGLHDLYLFTLASQEAVLMRLRSPGFDPTLEWYPPAFWYFLQSDTVDASRDAKIKAIMPAGTYGLVAGGYDFGVTGSYELGLSVTPQSADTCEFVLTFTGITTTQSLASTDCQVPATSANRFEDRFALIIEGGETVTLTETSTAYAPYLQLKRQGEVVAESNGSASGTATITFTSGTTAFYYIHASSVLELQQGAYNLSVSSAFIDASRTAARSTITNMALHRSIQDHIPAQSFPSPTSHRR